MSAPRRQCYQEGPSVAQSSTFASFTMKVSSGERDLGGNCVVEYSTYSYCCSILVKIILGDLQLETGFAPSHDTSPW